MRIEFSLYLAEHDCRLSLNDCNYFCCQLTSLKHASQCAVLCAAILWGTWSSLNSQ